MRFVILFLQVHANLDSRDVELFEVPGAFEIPLRAKLLACSGQYAGIVAAGLIVDGVSIATNLSLPR